LADISAVSGNQVWNATTNGAVDALASNGTDLYAGGAFSLVGGQAQNALAAFSPTTGMLNTTWAASAQTAGNTAGVVDALAVQGGSVYIGGTFAQIDGAPDSNLAAVDTVAGFNSGWNPGADGAVDTIWATDSTVFIGGAFAHVNGTADPDVAILSGTGSAAITNSVFSPTLNGAVLTLSRLNDVDGTLALGGGFTMSGTKFTGGAAIF
jgi:hypothetical protein